MSERRRGVVHQGGTGSAVYGLGFIGALVYFLQTQSGTFWLVIVGLFKSVFWPTFVVYELLKYLKM